MLDAQLTSTVLQLMSVIATPGLPPPHPQLLVLHVNCPCQIHHHRQAPISFPAARPVAWPAAQLAAAAFAGACGACSRQATRQLPPVQLQLARRWLLPGLQGIGLQGHDEGRGCSAWVSA